MARILDDDPTRNIPDPSNMDLSSVPWQARFAVLVGVPAIVCLYLVWWMTSSLDAQLKVIMTTQGTILSAQQSTINDGATYRRELETQTRILEAIRYSQFQICVNGLPAGRDTSACLGGGRQLQQQDR